MTKWENKFKKAVKDRQAFKKKHSNQVKFGIQARKGDKIMDLINKRRKSRLSNNNFNMVDFDYAGNSAEYSHLIKKGVHGPQDKTQLNFECKLRSYVSKTD